MAGQDNAFLNAVLLLAACSDDEQMTREEAIEFWQRLATYALDTAAEL